MLQRKLRPEELRQLIQGTPRGTELALQTRARSPGARPLGLNPGAAMSRALQLWTRHYFPSYAGATVASARC